MKYIYSFKVVGKDIVDALKHWKRPWLSRGRILRSVKMSSTTRLFKNWCIFKFEYYMIVCVLTYYKDFKTILSLNLPCIFSSVCCYLVWLTWVTVTSTPDTEAARDPTDEYFNDRGIQVGNRLQGIMCIIAPGWPGSLSRRYWPLPWPGPPQAWPWTSAWVRPVWGRGREAPGHVGALHSHHHPLHRTHTGLILKDCYLKWCLSASCCFSLLIMI